MLNSYRGIGISTMRERPGHRAELRPGARVVDRPQRPGHRPLRRRPGLQRRRRRHLGERCLQQLLLGRRAPAPTVRRPAPRSTAGPAPTAPASCSATSSGTSSTGSALADYKVGIHVVAGQRAQFTGSFLQPDIRRTDVGVLVDMMDDRWGMTLAGGRLEGSTRRGPEQLPRLREGHRHRRCRERAPGSSTGCPVPPRRTSPGAAAGTGQQSPVRRGLRAARSRVSPGRRRDQRQSRRCSTRPGGTAAASSTCPPGWYRITTPPAGPGGGRAARRVRRTEPRPVRRERRHRAARLRGTRHHRTRHGAGARHPRRQARGRARAAGLLPGEQPRHGRRAWSPTRTPIRGKRRADLRHQRRLPERVERHRHGHLPQRRVRRPQDRRRLLRPRDRRRPQ